MAFVIFTDAEGVYIGHCMGLGFWSKLDPADQPCATTFPTIQDAEEHMAGFMHAAHDCIEYLICAAKGGICCFKSVKIPGSNICRI